MNVYIIHRFVGKTRIIYSNQAYLKSTVAAHQLVKNKIMADIDISQINKEKENFQVAWEDIIDALKTNRNYKEVPEVCDWMQKVFNYNTRDNYKMRGLATVLAYKILEKPENIKEENLKLIRIVGWLIEVLQACIFMLDDIIDASITRRGKLCWYRNPDVGLSAVNDASLMYITVFDILKKYFGNTKYYPSISDTIGEYMLRITIGLILENRTTYKGRSDFSVFTNERYDFIVKHKTSICGVNLPIFIAMLLTDNNNELPSKKIEEICYELGRFLQIQNDVLDCYCIDKLTGKIGTDIQEGRCTWLSVQAYQKCNQSQRIVFENNFGKQEPQHVERIKLLYDELHLLDVFREEEDKIYKRILQQMCALPERVSPSIFYQYLDVYDHKSLALKPQ